MNYLDAADHSEIFVPHGFAERTVDLGEIRMNYATAGSPESPALLLIPGQGESWWGYEEAMGLLADRFQVFAVDLRGQGRSTWTPGRYSLDLFGGDLVRFLDQVVGRPAVVSGLSSGGVISAWLSAFARPGQVLAAVYEDPPLFSSETNPACGPSIRQGAGPIFGMWHKWLGNQWSIGDWSGFQAAVGRELPAWLLKGLARMNPDGPGEGLPQNLREYDPEWGHAFVSGLVAANCDHENMLAHVKVPVLFTHHFHEIDPATGNLLGAISDVQAGRVRELITGAGNEFTYRSFPDMPHSMHGHDPATYAETVTTWFDELRP
ncbi:alpha/beta hydrolase [Amycolatopsis acidicola]|uniref:Alpha/beta hydrolase n=1 Tax=Amycolatopsis acidicola TaxID=2596893 RepID=A0A5N0VK25_9PSEU|nr:alpha/beta hydrolase [Amycolatopsis acidicola]KAA9166545.1 alpha/beta hydrolase [Amycolatopsis acidicola]